MQETEDRPESRAFQCWWRRTPGEVWTTRAGDADQAALVFAQNHDLPLAPSPLTNLLVVKEEDRPDAVPYLAWLESAGPRVRRLSDDLSALSWLRAVEASFVLTPDQAVVAARNVGVDLTCGECAALFYTGYPSSLYGPPEHRPGCQSYWRTTAGSDEEFKFQLGATLGQVSTSACEGQGPAAESRALSLTKEQRVLVETISEWCRLRYRLPHPWPYPPSGGTLASAIGDALRAVDGSGAYNYPGTPSEPRTGGDPATRDSLLWLASSPGSPLVAVERAAILALVAEADRRVGVKIDSAKRSHDHLLHPELDSVEESAETLARVHERCDQSMTTRDWSVWTSNSNRRITAEGRRDGGVLSGAVQHHDRQPDLAGENLERDLAGICTLRNAAAEVATVLRALIWRSQALDAIRADCRRAEAMLQDSTVAPRGVLTRVRELVADHQRQDGDGQWRTELALLDALLAKPRLVGYAWRHDDPPRGVRCLVTTQGPGGRRRVRVGSVSPDHDGVAWFSDGAPLQEVVAWMPAPEPAVNQDERGDT